MSDKPYWQVRRDQKLGKPSPAPGKQEKSADQPAEEEKAAEALGAAKSPEKSPKTKKKGIRKVSKKKIKSRSKKMEKTVRDLKIAYGPYLEKNPVCVIQSPVCTHAATCVNHKAGRGANEILDKKTWEPSCGPCNSYIEDHDAWARENGHKISRLSKSK